ncbi:MAG TPA: C40 family peptidase [Gammaproteobacteria bacterium]|jgi:cell wall-associated NlpC family hydrolase
MKSIRLGLCALCIVSSGLLGCATGPEVSRVETSEPGLSIARGAGNGELAALIARRQIGVPYRFGGTSPDAGFDCSGLVYYSYSQAGIDLPRTSRELFRAARKISLADARPGDVVFFQDQEKLSHVGIYLGQRYFVHAPASGRTVSVAHIDTPYYQQHLVAVGRLVNL